jgi:ATP-binding protein involved in chromosome partitioning
MAVTEQQVRDALAGVIDPELKRPVTELDMVRSVRVAGDEVAVTIALTVAGCPLRHSFEDQVARVLAPYEVKATHVAFEVMTPDERAALTTKLRGGRPEKGISLDPRTRVLAIASGKGGVGKSTLTVNLAAALAARGEQVGVLDADVYGHSVPHMLGVRQRPVVVDKMIVPPVKGDLKLMSIGFFLDENSPVMWRGPMLHRALEQFLTDVHWGEVDTLLVDMPPGTGDVAISLGQLLPRSEVVVVTTPQPAAQDVAVRAAEMAQKIGQRVIGVIENMAGDVFGTGGGAELAETIGVPLLGSVALDPRLREQADEGEPLVAVDPDSPTSRAIAGIAAALAASRRGIRKQLPVLS